MRRSPLLAGLILFVAFLALYLGLGQMFRELPGYSEQNNIFFEADHRDALRGWIADHKGSHPLLLLVVVPLGGVLGRVFSSYETGMVVYAAVAGALAVVGFFGLVRVLTGRTRVAAPVAAFFGLTMSQLVFGSIPESYALSTLGILPSYYLVVVSLRRSRLFLSGWILAGIASFGITLTNVVHTVVCLGIVLVAVRERGRRLGPFVTWCGGVLGSVFLLSLLQRAVFPAAELFYLPATYAYEAYYTSAAVLERPLRVAAEILTTFFLRNVVGGFPQADSLECVKLTLTYYRAPIQLGVLGWTSAALWLGLGLHGVGATSVEPVERRVKLAASLSLAANMLLHAVYGTDQMFLYTAHFTFAVLLLAVGERSARGRTVRGLWWLLAALAGSSNLTVLWRILERFACRAS